MLCINQKPFFPLDNLIDYTYLELRYDDLIIGLIQSEKYLKSGSINEQKCIYDSNFIEPEVFLKTFKTTNTYQQLIDKNFNQQQILQYIKLKYPVKSIESKRLLLRSYPGGYNELFGAKHLARINRDTEAYQYFPVIKDWINKINVFSEVGRIIFFINPRGTNLPIHTDYADKISRKDQFIWINLFQKKKFFVMDNTQKIYADNRICIFDNANWHGSDPAEFECFSIRIDGIFSNDFLRLSGLENHFRN